MVEWLPGDKRFQSRHYGFACSFIHSLSVNQSFQGFEQSAGSGTGNMEERRWSPAQSLDNRSRSVRSQRNPAQSGCWLPGFQHLYCLLQGPDSSQHSHPLPSNFSAPELCFPSSSFSFPVKPCHFGDVPLLVLLMAPGPLSCPLLLFSRSSPILSRHVQSGFFQMPLAYSPSNLR